MKRLWIALICMLIGLASLPARRTLVANQRPANRTTAERSGVTASSRYIALAHCRVKFVDQVQLASDRTGVLDLVAPEGAHVLRGALVAHLRDRVAKAALAIVTEQAANDVEIRFARKASELAQLEYIRSLKANQALSGTVSEISLRQHRLAAERALLQLEQAENTLLINGLKRDESEELLKTYQVVAPFDGVVRQIFKKRGEAVREGEPILEIANTSRVRVEGYLPIHEMSRVKPGARVDVRLDIPNVDLPCELVSFRGRVAFVDVRVEPVSNKILFWAEVANHNSLLKDGLTAVMRIDPSDVDPKYVADRLAFEAIERAGMRN